MSKERTKQQHSTFFLLQLYRSYLAIRPRLFKHWIALSTHKHYLSNKLVLVCYPLYPLSIEEVNVSMLSTE